MRPLLRTLAGGRPGATYTLGDRTTVGRAAFADVQLVDASVSRFHALIERLVDGRYAIADLGSKAGMVVDGRAVRRAVLQLGSIVEICGSRLRYEMVVDHAPVDVGPKVNGLVTFRPTLLVSRTDDALTEALAPVSLEDRVTARWPAAAATPTLDTASEPEWLTLLRDIVELWARRDERGHASPRLRALAERFADRTDADGRGSSRRYPCRTPVLIGTQRGVDTVTLAGFMLDAGADGATVCTEDRLAVGRECWLLVATGDGERSGIAFRSLVAWVCATSGLAGMTFSARPVAGPEVLPLLHSRRIPRR